MPKNRTIASLVTTGLILLSASMPAAAQAAHATAPQTGGRSAAVSFARLLVEAAMDESGTPGMSVAVGVDGKIVWAEGFGFADLEQRVAVWEETKFRVGSVSKPITAAAVGLLVEQGKLDLDVPVQQYVPSFPEKPWPVTTRQAAGHTAGIRHYRDEEFLSSKFYPTVTEGLEIFENDDLLFEPGTQFSYSSYGWNLVSAVVEGAAGVPFLEYMQTQVFDVLDLEHTVADVNSRIVPQRTRFYDKDEDGHVANAPYVDNSYKWAGGGFLSTPSDLIRFAFAHFGSEFLKAETVATLLTPLETPDGESTDYGVGWFVNVEEGAVVRAGHGGGSMGGTTGFSTRPPERAAVAVTGNMSSAPTGGMITRLILDAFLDPEALASSASASDLSGTRYCAIERRNRPLIAELTLLGGPAAYWGRIGDRRIVHATGTDDGARIIAVSDGGSFDVIDLASGDDGTLTGSFNFGPAKVECADEAEKLPGYVVEIAVDPAILASYAGTYEIAPGFDLTIRHEGARLFGQATGQAEVEIFAESETRFFAKVVDAQITFVPGEDGPAPSLVLHQGGRDTPAKRKD